MDEAGAAQSCSIWVGKTSNFDNIHSINTLHEFCNFEGFLPLFSNEGPVLNTGWANAHPIHPVAPPLSTIIGKYLLPNGVLLIQLCDKGFDIQIFNELQVRTLL